jgi:mannose-6-phosphate isomerase-like protein (cupin superfamily)
MIFATGRLKPERFQLEEARKNADGSFCVNYSEQFGTHFPVFEGFTPADSGILLKLKNVEPHEDPWVSRQKEPRARRSIFWLLEGGGQAGYGSCIHFGCGAKIIKMFPGDFVIFNDSKTHWVMSEKQWRGAAVQLVTI